MESKEAIHRLAALAQEARLHVFRLLVRTGTEGMSAGEIAAKLDMPPQTLSFHLKHLTTADLIESRREGRSLIYSLRVDSMRELLAFLSEDCCQGRRELCVPLGKSPKARIAEAALEAQPPTVLFLCSKNSTRSQMAEALLRKHAGDRFAVHSAGLRPEAVHPMTLQVLKEVGIDTSGCEANDFGKFMGRIPIHFAIVVCERANKDCPNIHPFAVKRLYWPFEDPAAFEGSKAAQLKKFRDVRDAIEARIKDWIVEMAPSLDSVG
jgi:protein-tyrosine-phosphatase/DNA-binding transcriptional ArsR family regulator